MVCYCRNGHEHDTLEQAVACGGGYTANIAHPVTDFADRVEPNVEKLKQRIYVLEQTLANIHELSK